MKRSLFSVILIGAICIAYVIFYVLDRSDPWNDPEVTHGLIKGQKFILIEDTFLYCYTKKYSIVPDEHFRFTIEDFRRDSSIGRGNPKAPSDSLVEMIVPKGTVVRFDSIRRSFDWNSGGFWKYYGYIEDEGVFDGEVSISHIILEPKFMKKK